MSNEYDLFRMAITEAFLPGSDTPQDYARAYLFGASGIHDDITTKEDFVNSSVSYIENFDDLAEVQIFELKRRIEELGSDDTRAQFFEDVIAEIESLQRKAKNIDMDEFIRIAMDDWDECHKVEEDDLESAC